MERTPEFIPSNKVLKILYDLKLRDFRERYEELRRPDIIYVTDITSCSHKYVLRQQYPDLIFSFEPITVLGELIHVGLEYILEKEGYNVEYSIEKEYDIDGRIYRLKGRIDAYKPDEGIVVEIKTSRSIQGAPREHHVEQLVIYMNMVEAERGILIYVTPDGIHEYSFSRRSFDIEKRIMETVNDEVHPRWDWECRYCAFSKLCPFRREVQGKSM